MRLIFPILLLLSLLTTGWGQDPPEEFQYNQSAQQALYIFYEVNIGGVVVDAEDWVGAFNGDVCVGSAQWDTSLCNGNVCVITLFINVIIYTNL